MSNIFEQQPFSGAEFAENPEPRCPCLLLLDVSLSMRGKPLAELNDGLCQFGDELYADSLAAKRVEVGIIQFGPVRVLNDFTGVHNWTAPHLIAQGDTPMGAAIEHGLTMLKERKDSYRNNGVSYYRPWVFLITDGGPSDPWHNAARLIKEGEEQKAFSFFAVGVEGANMEILTQLSVRTPLTLQGLKFRELFAWLSSSLGQVSRSNPGDAVPLQNPAAPNGWASI